MRSAVIGFLFAFASFASDLTGVWVGVIQGRKGEPLDIAFRFAPGNTGALEGKLYGDYGSSLIQDVRIAGSLITFTITMEEQAGNEINTTRFRFSGRIGADEIELTRDRELSTTATNDGPAKVREEIKQTFRLKRLYGRTRTAGL
ncbi:MAG: hypothetical protein H7039_08570 [Bryobacteraceae bacterium]|nr:hypothetical protein [Bryobacteraceae bacterium]